MRNGNRFKVELTNKQKAHIERIKKSTIEYGIEMEREQGGRV